MKAWMHSTQTVLAQVWYNADRGRKPQSFTQEPALADPTDGGRTCDFCRWQTLTAVDVFGRWPASPASTLTLLETCMQLCGSAHVTQKL